MDEPENPREAEANDVIDCLDRKCLIGHDPLDRMLTRADEARQSASWETAAAHIDNARDYVEGIRSRSGSADSLQALVAIYTGACHHAQNHLYDGMQWFAKGRQAAGTLDGHNRAVAQFALAIVHAIRDEQRAANSCFGAAWDVLGATHKRDVVRSRWKKVEQWVDLWQQTQRMLPMAPQVSGQAQPPATEAAKPVRPPGEPNKWLGSRAVPGRRRPLTHMLGIIALFCVLGAELALLLAIGNEMGNASVYSALITLFILVPVLLVLWLILFDYTVPHYHAAAIEHLGIAEVEPAGKNRLLIPMIDQFRALVPLYLLEYAHSITVPIANGETAELDIRMGYSVHIPDSRIDPDGVVAALNIQNAATYAQRSQSAVHSNWPLRWLKGTPRLSRETESLWQAGLTSALEYAACETLGGISYSNLANPSAEDRRRRNEELRNCVAAHTQDSGLSIKKIFITRIVKTTPTIATLPAAPPVSGAKPGSSRTSRTGVKRRR